MFMAAVGFRILLTLRGYARGSGAQHRTLPALLGKNHDPHLARLRVCGRIQAERNRTRAEILQLSDPLQAAYHACMLEAVPTVFTAMNLGRVLGVYQSGVEVRLFGCRWSRGGDGGGDFLPVHNRLREDQLDLGGLRGMLDGANGMFGIVVDRLLC